MAWISVKDKSPENVEKDYLVVVKYPSGLREQMVVEWFFDGVSFKWLPNINGSVLHKITHWKELDELPIND